MAVRLPALRDQLHEHNGPHAALLLEFAERLQNIIGEAPEEDTAANTQENEEEEKYNSEHGLYPFIAIIRDTIDLELVNEEHEYKLKAEYDADLSQLQAHIDTLKAQLDGVFHAARRALSMDDKRMHLENNSTHGYYFRIRYLRRRILTTNKTPVNMLQQLFYPFCFSLTRK